MLYRTVVKKIVRKHYCMRKKIIWGWKLKIPFIYNEKRRKNLKVRVIREKETTYLADLIGNEYQRWYGKKILISAPTGMGKSTFVVDTLLEYAKNQFRKTKMLILCNRKLLRMQYWNDLVQRFGSYAEIDGSVKVMTYQELAEMMKHQIPLKEIVYGYGLIVFDECHYFYADSDFNGYGTYALLQEIACEGVKRTMIFMSATMDEVKPLIAQTVKNCLTRLSRTGRMTEDTCNYGEILDYDFSEMADYTRFQCTCVPDWETLCEMLAESSKKSVIFLNNKEKGAGLVEKLTRTGKIEKGEIIVLNADNMDCESEVVQHLAISHKLIPKILITTAVLDNGVSIKDAEVGNIVIETESKIEFLQMLGRVRAESVNSCTLFFVQRDRKDFQNRKNRYKEEMERLEKLTTRELRTNREFYIQTMWNRDEMAEFYRKVLVWMKFQSQFFVWPENESLALNLQSDFYINEFAKRKIGDMYVAESNFYAMAMSDPLKVVYAQMAWIGKAPEELQIMGSGYRERRQEEFVSRLLQCQNYTLEKLKNFKISLVKEFKKEFFADIQTNNGTLSGDKLDAICQHYGLVFESNKDSETRIEMYSIKKICKEEDGC